MFVAIISLVLFSFLGWPNLAWRIISRLLLMPVIRRYQLRAPKVGGQKVMNAVVKGAKLARAS